MKDVRVLTIKGSILFDNVKSYMMSEVNNALYINDNERGNAIALFNKDLVFGVVDNDYCILYGQEHPSHGYIVHKDPSYDDDYLDVDVFVKAYKYEYDVTKHEVIFYAKCDDPKYTRVIGIFNMDNVLYIERFGKEQ